jgi:hypothetical protein
MTVWAEYPPALSDRCAGVQEVMKDHRHGPGGRYMTRIETFDQLIPGTRSVLPRQAACR